MVVGFVICKVLDSHLPLDIKQRIGQIDTIVVDKTIENYGLITAGLYDRAEHYLQDAGCLVTDAAAVVSNKRLHQAMLDRGFYPRTPQVIIYRKGL